MTGPSSATRASHQRAISSAWRLVSEAEKRHPTLPVQATSPARMDVALVDKPERVDRGLGERHLVGRHARDQEVLPDREADIAVAEISRDLGEAAHLRAAELADRQHHADPVQSGLLLGMHADMGEAVERRPRRDRVGGDVREFAPEFFLDRSQEFFEAPRIEHIFQPRLVAVGAIAMLDEDAHDRVGNLGGVWRRDDHPGIAREIAVTGNSAERKAEPYAGLDAEPVFHHDRLKADVVGVFQNRNDAGAIERRR